MFGILFFKRHLWVKKWKEFAYRDEIGKLPDALSLFYLFTFSNVRTVTKGTNYGFM